MNQERMSESPLDIRLLGLLEVERDDRAVTLPRSRKARALLAYLAATARPQSREHLCDLLWPHPADPRAALRGALSKLRPLVDDTRATRLVAVGDGVAFEPEGARVDYLEVRRVAADREKCDLKALCQAAGAFRGSFLVGLDVPRCYRFEAWCMAERESARRARVSILATLTSRLRDCPAEALGFARQRLVIDPSAESAHLDVIRLLTELGRRDEAREQFRTCRRILKAELGMQPSRELEAVRRMIGPAGLSRAPPLPVAPRHPPASPPLVGRRRELDALREVVACAGSRVREPLVVVAGEAGSGKTRLLEEVTTLVHEAGGEVLAGKAFEAETVRPFGVWIELLRAIPPEEVPAELRPELAPLLPELGEAHTESPDRTRLFDGVARLVAARLEFQQPLVLLLDDLQWIDDASAALLHYIVRAAPAHLVVICAAQPAELQDNLAASRLLRALRRTGELHELDLMPLDAAATAQLAKSVAPELDPQQIFVQGGGNPLFTIEIARAGKEADGSLPATLDGLIAERLSKLATPAHALIPWAAALGHDFTLQALDRVAEMPSTDLLLAVEELERRHVLKAASGGYSFTHELVRQVAYRRISEPRRRLIHSRIARMLSDGGDPDGEIAGEVAHHAILAGERELAARACLAAARSALWKFAPGEAAELAARGIAQLEGLATEIRLPLHVELLGFAVYPGMKEHRAPDLEFEISRVLGEARTAGLNAEVSRGFQLISYLHFLSGDFGGALDRSLLAQEVGRAADPVTVVRAIGDTARCLGILDRDLPRAERLAREARSLAEGIGYEGHEIPQALGLVHHHAGRWDEATERFERAAHLARRERERWFECISLAHLVMIELERARPAEAVVRCQLLLSVTGQLGEGSEAPFAEALEALARIGAGGDDDLEAVDRALTSLRHADSRWMIAYVQNAAASIELNAGRLDSALRRIDEALHAANLVDRRNEIAVSRALAAQLAVRRQDGSAADVHLNAVRAEVERPGVLSHRAQAAVAAATAALRVARAGLAPAE